MNKDKEVEAYKSGNLTPEEQTKYEIAQEPVSYTHLTLPTIA